MQLHEKWKDRKSTSLRTFAFHFELFFTLTERIGKAILNLMNINQTFILLYLSALWCFLHFHHANKIIKSSRKAAQALPMTIHFQVPLGSLFPLITIFALVWSRDANKAPPEVLSSWTHITLFGAFFLSSATLIVKDSFHLPSSSAIIPEVGQTSSLSSVESFWYKDHCTVILPCDPFALRTGISSLVTCLARETATTPSLL